MVLLLLLLRVLSISGSMLLILIGCSPVTDNTQLFILTYLTEGVVFKTFLVFILHMCLYLLSHTASGEVRDW